jgi:GWxTD domain-containing protein
MHRFSTRRRGRRNAPLWRMPLVAAIVASFGLQTACWHRAARPSPAEGPVGRVVTPEAVNATDTYRRAGFLTATGDIPFVGAARCLAGPTDDQTLVVIAFSFPNRSLTFTRDGEQYRAAYDVSYDVRSGTTTVQHRSARSEVRVGSFRETQRSEESVIAQQVLTLPPGSYTLEIATRDASAPRAGKATAPLVVPRFANTSAVTIVPVYQVEPRSTRAATPHLVANPRSTVVFGRDSLLQLYLEAYGTAAPRWMRVQVDAGSGGILYADSVSLPTEGEIRSTVAQLPVYRIGFGVLYVTLTPRDTGAPVRLPVVVRPGDELAVASFEEVVQYLRFFAAPERLRALRDTTPAVREQAWAALLRETDSVASTPENEALRDYLKRVQTANAQYREDEIPGWITDRGKVFSALGEPDQMSIPSGGDSGGRGMTQVWDYRERHLQFVFVDQSGLGQWRLTPASQLEFDAAFKRLTSCATCR